MEFDAWQDKLSETLHSLAEQAIDRFGLKSVAMAHRTGSVGPGENIVAIHVASPHRKEAFEGCSWLIDELKGQAPLWKKKSSQAGQHGKQDWGEKMEKSIQGVIDIGGKPIVHRRASATGVVHLTHNPSKRLQMAKSRKAMSWKHQQLQPYRQSKILLVLFLIAILSHSRDAKLIGRGKTML